METNGLLCINGKIAYDYRDFYPSDTLRLFENAKPLRVNKKNAVNLAKQIAGQDYEELIGDSENPIPFVGVKTNVKELMDKLMVVGVNKKSYYESYNEDIKYLFLEIDKEQKLLQLIKEGNETEIDNFITTENIEPTNEMFLLYKILKNKKDEDVFLITEEYKNRQNDSGPTPVNYLREPIIITEGTFDKYVLEKSLLILYPHLTNYIHFLDMDFKPENGVDMVIKTIKSFAAAHMNDRILAIIDNDTAANCAIKKLNDIKLPQYIQVIRYPDIKRNDNYPTIGPSGRNRDNINGRAASIETYLPQETLLDDTSNALIPIRWKDYRKDVDEYHGSIENKELINKRFKQWIKINGPSESSASLIPELETVWRTIIEKLSDM